MSETRGHVLGERGDLVEEEVSVNELIGHTLQEQVLATERREAEVHLASIARSPNAAGLSRETLMARADLEKWYREKKVWFRHRGDKRSRWIRGTCLDFRAPGMQMRVIPDGSDRVRTVDPARVEIENRPERTLRLLENQIQDLEKKLTNFVEAQQRMTHSQSEKPSKRGRRRPKGKQQAAPATPAPSLAVQQEINQLRRGLDYCKGLAARALAEIDRERKKTARLLKEKADATV